MCEEDRFWGKFEVIICVGCLGASLLRRVLVLMARFEAIAGGSRRVTELWRTVTGLVSWFCGWLRYS